MKTSIRRLGAAAVLAVLAGTASAHTGHGTHGLAAGLQHPLALDHLLAMCAVGVWSVLALRGPQRVLGPLVFIATMLVGAAFGLGGVQMPLVEQGIAASVVLCGVMVIFATRLAPGVGLALDMSGDVADPIDIGDGGPAEFQHQQGHGLVPGVGALGRPTIRGPAL